MTFYTAASFDRSVVSQSDSGIERILYVSSFGIADLFCSSNFISLSGFASVSYVCFLPGDVSSSFVGGDGSHLFSSQSNVSGFHNSSVVLGSLFV